MIDLGELDRKVLKELQYLHEEWSNMELIPTSTYGVRMYQNGSSTVMHYDRTEVHVISSIVHIAHQYDDDNEPWPIEIEDQNGDLHAVLLEEGEMLFYEGAISLHGRRSALKGKYYGSLFLHYKPADKSIWNYTTEDIIAHILPHWSKGILEDHGSRWAGQAITTDSMIAAGAPERYVGVNLNMGVPLTLLSGEMVLDLTLLSGGSVGDRARRFSEQDVDEIYVGAPERYVGILEQGVEDITVSKYNSISILKFLEDHKGDLKVDGSRRISERQDVEDLAKQQVIQ
eukprot:gene12257-16436_t